jgi:hypothetical protein
MGLEQPAPIARALAHRDNFCPRQLSKVLDAHLDGAIRAFAADLEFPTTDIDFRNVGEMVSHEESIVRGDGRSEIFDWRLIVRRPVSQLNERLLARESIENRFCACTRGQGRRKIECGLGLRLRGEQVGDSRT